MIFISLAYDYVFFWILFFFFKQKTAYDVRIRDWSSAVCSSDLFVDETTVKVLAPGTGKTKTGYMWVIVCDDRAHGGADPPLALYTYLPGRGKMWAKQLLGTYQGILQVDAWQAYDQFGKDAGANAGVEKSYCWAHLRRKFMDAGSDAPIAQDALQRIARIYSIEKEEIGRASGRERVCQYG